MRKRGRKKQKRTTPMWWSPAVEVLAVHSKSTIVHIYLSTSLVTLTKRTESQRDWTALTAGKAPWKITDPNSKIGHESTPSHLRGRQGSVP